MTQTLTTERLREIAERSSPSLRWGEAEKIAAECLANREAQPVEWGAPKTVGQMIGQLKTLDPAMETTALLRMPADFRDGNAIRQVPISISFERLDGMWLAPYKGEGRKVLAFWAKVDHREETERGELLTAPPAPAVPDGFCIMPLTLTAANGAKGALSGEFKVSRTVRCHECGGEGCDDCADAGEFEEEITIPWDTIKEIYRAAVDSCRAAMLAQPQIEPQNIPNNIPDGFAAAVNRLLDSDGSRGCFSAVRSYDAREEIERLLAQPVSQGCKWIARGEQLPAIGETVLVSSDGYVSIGELERSGANYRYFTSVATGRELTVTHWMPLPAAPEGGN